MKIDISHKCGTVAVRIYPKLHDEQAKGWSWGLEIKAVDPMMAEFIGDRLLKDMRDTLSLIREEAYEAGQRDAKGHHKRLRHFNACWNPDVVGWPK